MRVLKKWESKVMHGKHNRNVARQLGGEEGTFL
jgi:hypothetical protein